MVSDHLGDDDEWMWVKGFAKETGLPVTLVATSAGAYEGNKMYNIAEESRRAGHGDPPADRRAADRHPARPDLQLPHLRRHPTYRREIAHLPLEEKVAVMQRAGDPRGAAGRGQHRSASGADGGRRRRSSSTGSSRWASGPTTSRTATASVGGLAEAAGVTPLEMMYDLLIRDGGRELFYQPLGGYVTYNFDFFRKNMQHPNVLFGLSDGGAHCGVIADAGMPTFILTHWAPRPHQGRAFPLEFLVRKLTSDTARAYGLNDRGQLKPGLLADLNVIDFDEPAALPARGGLRPAGRRPPPGAARRRLPLHGQVRPGDLRGRRVHRRPARRAGARRPRGA